MTANILVVDDLEPNIKLLEAKLLNEYYTVFTASSGGKALEILDNNKIDIVLLDVMMPQMSGFETCLKIKANPKTAYIPVVMVTALTDIEDRVQGLEAGADEFLSKPINDIALFTRIKSLTRMKAAMDELYLRHVTNESLGVSGLPISYHFHEDSKILLINDDAIQTSNILRILQRVSKQVKTIANLSDYEMVSNEAADIIIVSYQLEEMDPLRIIASLRSKEMLRNSIIVLVVEEEEFPIVAKAVEVGIDDYLIYPIEENELIARIKTLIKKKKYQDELRTLLEQSINLSLKDGLTNVFNRRYFDLHIHSTINAFASNHSIALLIGDIDDFKQVNDRFGHLMGDEVLKIVADTIKKNIRVTDLVARYGGEEFVVLLPNTNNNEAMKVAERICRAVETIRFVNPGLKDNFKVTISLGVAGYKIGEMAADFIYKADKALYKAKVTGKNKAVLG